MKKEIVYILLIIHFLYSCKGNISSNNSKSSSADTLVYKYIEFKKRAGDCGNKPDSGCVYVRFKYPSFIGQNALNDSIKEKAVNMFSFIHRRTNFRGIADTLFSMYFAPYPPNFVFPSLNEYVKVLRQDSAIITLEANGCFRQTDHPLSYTYFINWNIGNKTTISLHDLFNPGYTQKLCKIAEGLFRKNERSNDTTSFTKRYRFTNGKFKLNNNYSITPVGIRFLYNESEIKEYAKGVTELLIPYAKIKSLLRPNTVVTQYLK